MNQRVQNPLEYTSIKYKFTKYTEHKAKKNDWGGLRPFQWLFWNTNNRHPTQKSGIPVFSSRDYNNPF